MQEEIDRESGKTEASDTKKWTVSSPLGSLRGAPASHPPPSHLVEWRDRRPSPSGPGAAPARHLAPSPQSSSSAHFLPSARGACLPPGELAAWDKLPGPSSLPLDGRDVLGTSLLGHMMASPSQQWAVPSEGCWHSWRGQRWGRVWQASGPVGIGNFQTRAEEMGQESV